MHDHEDPCKLITWFLTKVDMVDIIVYELQNWQAIYPLGKCSVFLYCCR